MTLARRRRSFKPSSRDLFWGCLAGLSLLLAACLRFGPIPPLLPRSVLLPASHLPFLLIVWSFGWRGPLWGLGATSWFSLLVLLLGLSSREGTLVGLSAAFAICGLLSHRGLHHRQAAVQARALSLDHLQERLNTFTEDLKRLQELEAAANERLRRYQQLRQVANAFNLTLPLDDLMDCMVRASGELVRATDHALLYLVDPATLQLELKKVWRRAGSATIKAKKGDSFDQWVMRQGQPLLVEEVARDFRFPERTREHMGRPVGSLLAVPLFTEHRQLGVLRLEAALARGLTSDDLRLVRILGDLASLGIENGLLYSRTAQLAMTDDLTGLAVRGQFLKHLEERIGPARQGGTALSVLLIDIDRFKDYNDTFGHSAGDKLLKEIAGALLQTRRPQDVAARWGGEEFACLYPGAGREEAMRRGEQLRQRVEATPVEFRRSVEKVTLSIGVASFPLDGASGEALLAAADRRLYRAKSAGRNQVCSAD